MLRSMTGFGRCVTEDESWSQTWEIKSVNSRHLDLKWHLSQNLHGLEITLEKIARTSCLRGRLDITLTLFRLGNGAELSWFNEAQAASMLKSLKNLAEKHGEMFVPDYNALLGIQELWVSGADEDNDDLNAWLEEGFRAAIEDWNESRETEGSALLRDISDRIDFMEERIQALESFIPDLIRERRETLCERIREASASFGVEADENRLLQEIVILTDRLDVSEEITRFKTHIARLRDVLHAESDIGRRLDFTLQECFREITTCGNKIQNAELSKIVVDIKNELEKCREQAQNIE
ncbi:MAG: YicC family protein [Desulfovibrionaceae bacterium]|nr:YicC family protein [Desulfovibrionaceae bacterium]